MARESTSTKKQQPKSVGCQPAPRKQSPGRKLYSISTHEEYKNGIPCKHEDCSNTLRRLPCRYCGRARMRGNVIIEDRTGHVHLERLRAIDIQLHNELPVDVQETSTLHIFRAPKNSDT